MSAWQQILSDVTGQRMGRGVEVGRIRLAVELVDQ